MWDGGWGEDGDVGGGSGAAGGWMDIWISSAGVMVGWMWGPM